MYTKRLKLKRNSKTKVGKGSPFCNEVRKRGGSDNYVYRPKMTLPLLHSTSSDRPTNQIIVS